MDVVDGVVTDVCNESTFLLRVTRSLAANQQSYAVQERIAVADLDSSACTWDHEMECSAAFLRRQRWHPVTCQVLHRSQTGELVCNVRVQSGC